MVNVRHYAKDGTPAYITVWNARGGPPWVLVHLLYARAPGFDKAWADGMEWSAAVLDIPTRRLT